MTYQISKQDVWAGSIQDHAGGLAEKLEAFSGAGVNLEFMIARRAPDKPGTGVVFISPLQGQAAIGAAEQAGLKKWTTACSLRIDGPDQPGLGAKITRAVGRADINMRGASAARIGDRCIFQLAFDSEADADKASAALTQALNG